MGAGFHAFKNIGFSFLKSEAACRKWRDKFSGFDPERAVRLLGVKTDDRYAYVTYLGTEYRLELKTGILEKKTGIPEEKNVKPERYEPGIPEKQDAGLWTEDVFMNEALVVYHYLGDTKEYAAREGIWVPESSLDPVSVRSDDRTNPLLKGFAGDYEKQAELLAKQCEKIGGKVIASQGDAAWEFLPLPHVPMRLVFWEADEDFPAQVQVLVDRRATDYVHYEALGFIAADLFVKINEQMKGTL